MDEEGDWLVGGKNDIKKCFGMMGADTRPSRFGRPGGGLKGVVRVLRKFYKSRKRWVEFEGAVADGVIKMLRALLQ